MKKNLEFRIQFFEWRTESDMTSRSENLELDINIYNPGQWFSVTSLKEILFIVKHIHLVRVIWLNISHL